MSEEIKYFVDLLFFLLPVCFSKLKDFLIKALWKIEHIMENVLIFKFSI